MCRIGIVIIATAMLALAGCTRTYVYKAITQGCDCPEYVVRGDKFPVDYRFWVTYEMKGRIITNVEIEFTNRGTDSLLLYPGSVRVSSRNVSYQYNNRYVGLPFIVVHPGKSETVRLRGEDITPEEDWIKIAGERLKVTVRGLRLGEVRLPETTVEFVPENPKLGE